MGEFSIVYRLADACYAIIIFIGFCKLYLVLHLRGLYCAHHLAKLLALDSIYVEK